MRKKTAEQEIKVVDHGKREALPKPKQKRDAKQRIIWILGQEGAPLIPHNIARKTGLTDAGVQTAIKSPRGLMLAGLLKPFGEPKDWRAKGKTVEYILTFRGVIEYLDLIEERVETAILSKDGFVVVGRRNADAEIEKFIQKYCKFYNYVPFKNHGALREWLGDATYGFFSAAARNVKLGHLPYIVTAERLKFLEMEMRMWSDELDETESVLNDLKRISKYEEAIFTKTKAGKVMRDFVYTKIEAGKKKKITTSERIATLESQRDELRRVIQDMEKDMEKLWMRAFSLMLFELIALYTKGKIKRMPNEAIYEHIKKTFKEEMEECRGRLKNIREMMVMFDGVFSLRPKILRPNRKRPDARSRAFE